MIHKCTIKLALDGGELPTEFRLFKKGWNDTENGRYLFDDEAAKSVMACYAAWGVDLAIDLEHGMLELEAGGPDPTARDARGWCNLELRNDGSLWAVNVHWTADGAARLSEKRQRYVSPAFDADRETKRIMKMINIAITAIPATHKTPALVAANRKIRKAKTMSTQVTKLGSMHPDLLKQALDAIEKGDVKAAMELLKSLIADAAGAPPEPDGDEDGSEGDGADGVATEERAEAVEKPKVVPASAVDGEDDEKDEGDEKKKMERKAMRAMLRRLTDSKTFAEALARVGEYRASHMTLETERAKLAKERSVMESAERRALVAELVKLGAEFPSTVWADDKATTVKPRWAKMPIAELRAHVSEQRAARKGQKPAGGVQPGKTDGGTDATVTLSAQELAICEQMKCDPKDFVALKAFRDGKKAGN